MIAENKDCFPESKSWKETFSGKNKKENRKFFLCITNFFLEKEIRKLIPDRERSSYQLEFGKKYFRIL